MPLITIPFVKKILDIIPDKDFDYVSDILDDFKEELLNHCVYWNEKYYRCGFCDGSQLVMGYFEN